jgi:hypothetical protein
MEKATIVPVFHLGLAPDLAKHHRRLLIRSSPTNNESLALVIGTKPGAGFTQDQRVIQFGVHPIPSSRADLAHCVLEKMTSIQNSQDSSLLYEALVGIRLDLEQYIQTIIESQLLQEATLFQQIYSVWLLAEIVLFSPILKTPFTPDVLLDWIHRSKIDVPSQVEFEDIIQSPNPSIHPQFWKFTRTCILRGIVNAAILLLEHAAAQSRETGIYLVLVDLLKKMPKFNGSVKNILPKWNEWRQECEYFQSEVVLGSLVQSEQELDQARQTLGILVGNVSIIRNSSPNWMVALASELMFCKPTANIFDIPDLLSDSDVQLSSDPFERIIYSIFSKDVSAMLKWASSLDWWLPTHLCFFLNAFELLDVPAFDAKKDTFMILEHFVLGYANNLLIEDAFGMTLTGLRYLLLAGKAGKSHFHEWAIRKIHLNGLLADKILELCHEHRMFSTATAIHRLLGQIFFKARDYSKSLEHFALANDHLKFQDVCDFLLRQYLAGSLTIDQLRMFIQAIHNPDEPLYHDNKSFVFIVRYLEFKELLDQGEFKDAATLVCLLLTANLTPPFFRSDLIYSACQLIEKHVDCFSAHDLLDLLRCLQEVVDMKLSQESQTHNSRTVLLKAIEKSFLCENEFYLIE